LGVTLEFVGFVERVLGIGGEIFDAEREADVTDFVALLLILFGVVDIFGGGTSLGDKSGGREPVAFGGNLCVALGFGSFTSTGASPSKIELIRLSSGAGCALSGRIGRGMLEFAVGSKILTITQKRNTI
jgi:hypothetical protein